MIINDLDGYYIVFDTKNWNTELDTLPFYFKGKHYCFTILEVSKSIKSMYDDRIEKDMDAVQDMMSYLNL